MTRAFPVMFVAATLLASPAAARGFGGGSHMGFGAGFGHPGPRFSSHRSFAGPRFAFHNRFFFRRPIVRHRFFFRGFVLGPGFAAVPYAAYGYPYCYYPYPYCAYPYYPYPYYPAYPPYVVPP